MKRLKYKKIKLLFSFVIVSFMCILFCNVNAYQIKHIVMTKEGLYPSDGTSIPGNFPNMIYKKQVSAYAETITKYKNGKYTKDALGWVYETLEER